VSGAYQDAYTFVDTDWTVSLTFSFPQGIEVTFSTALPPPEQIASISFTAANETGVSAFSGFTSTTQQLLPPPAPTTLSTPSPQTTIQGTVPPVIWKYNMFVSPELTEQSTYIIAASSVPIIATNGFRRDSAVDDDGGVTIAGILPPANATPESTELGKFEMPIQPWVKSNTKILFFVARVDPGDVQHVRRFLEVSENPISITIKHPSPPKRQVIPIQMLSVPMTMPMLTVVSQRSFFLAVFVAVLIVVAVVCLSLV
jgi:hypothetical protein